MKQETFLCPLSMRSSSPSGLSAETHFRELCLELATEGGFSERFQRLWLHNPVSLSGDELEVICRFAGPGMEIARALNERWRRIH